MLHKSTTPKDYDSISRYQPYPNTIHRKRYNW